MLVLKKIQRENSIILISKKKVKKKKAKKLNENEKKNLRKFKGKLKI